MASEPQRLYSGLLKRAMLASALAGAGALYQAVATAEDEDRYPPPGRLVDVGGYRLHITCAGTGSPTVILEAGLGAFSVDWRLVQSEVARFTRVCAYDRAGYGWSEPGPTPRSAARGAQELHTLLQRAEVPGPYVLVGHSYGGFITRLYAQDYRDEVAGMVLVDTTHEDLRRRLPVEARRDFDAMERAELVTFRLAHALASFGVVRTGGKLGLIPSFDVFEKLPAEAQAVATAFRYRSRYFATSYDEDAAFRLSTEQVRATGTFGRMPLVVLRAGGGSAEEGWLLRLLGRDGMRLREVRQVRTALHAELARKLSASSTYIVAERSGHLIPISQPQLVVDAIRQAIMAAQQAR